MPAQKIGMRARLALAIFRAYPPLPTNNVFKEVVGRPESEYNDEVKNPTPAMFSLPSNCFVGKDVVDLGSGYGGRTVRYAELGANSVTGIEVSKTHVDASVEFSEQKNSIARFLVGAGESIPLPDRCADLILMNDVMEHVVDPASVVAECSRILRSGGLFAVTFPPYYALDGGSHLHGYATRAPGLNIFFPTESLKDASKILFEEKQIDFRKFFREAPTDKLWNMNGLTIKKWDRIIDGSQFERTMMERVAFKPNAPKPISLPFSLLANIPVLKEAFCRRTIEVLRKR